MTTSQSHVRSTNLLFNYYLFAKLGFRYFIAGFFTQTISLNLSISIWPVRIECRTFLVHNGAPIVPCCDRSNHKTLCQPDTGIARVIVDIVDLIDPTASLFCKSGVDLSSILPLVVDCQSNGQSKYCSINDNALTKPECKHLLHY